MARAPRPDGYWSWQAMISRCEKLSDAARKNYGGRGIKVCARWRYSFATFIQDMGPRPSKLHSVERKDTNGDYEPKNCYWATMKQQQNNRRNNRKLTHNGRTMTVSQWADELGISQYALHERMKRGMSIEQALTFKPPLIEFDGKKLSATEWAKITGIKRATIQKRIARNWTPEKTLTCAVRDWGR